MALYTNGSAGSGLLGLGNSVYNGSSQGGHTHAIGNIPAGVPLTDVIETINDRLQSIEKLLLIVQEQQVLNEKYPALKEAYDHYQMVLAMVHSPPEK